MYHRHGFSFPCDGAGVRAYRNPDLGEPAAELIPLRIAFERVHIGAPPSRSSHCHGAQPCIGVGIPEYIEKGRLFTAGLPPGSVLIWILLFVTLTQAVYISFFFGLI